VAKASVAKEKTTAKKRAGEPVETGDLLVAEPTQRAVAPAVPDVASKPAEVETTSFKVKLKSGREVEFEVPVGNAELDHAIFVLGVRKSGSTVMNRIWMKAAKRLQVPFVDVGGTLFKQDIKASGWADDPAIAEIFRPGYVYGGFRSSYAHFSKSPVFMNAKKILLVRDPRDALVSQYFSTLKTHSLPQQNTGPGGAADQLLKQREAAKNMSIDDYVLMNARSFRNTLQEYAPLLEDPNLKVFHYEDVILEKGPWIHQMLKFAGLPAPKQFIERVAEEFNVVPSTENPNNFIRKVTPGDHAEKLRKSTIEALNLIFGELAQKFGYRLR
jgi:hypothetical protein